MRKKCSGLRPCEGCQKRNIPCTFENPNKKRGPPSSTTSKSQKSTRKKKQSSENDWGSSPLESLSEENVNEESSDDQNHVPKQTDFNYSSSQGTLQPPSPGGKIMSSKESMSTGSIQSGLDWSEFQYLDVDHFPPIKMKNGSNVEWTFLYFRYINFAFPLFSEYQFECSNLSPILLHSMYLMVHLCPNVEVSNERIERHFAYCQILQGNSAEWPDPTSTVSLYLLSVFRSIKYPNQQNVNVGIKLALRYGHHISLSGGTHFRHRNQHMVTLESKGFSKPWYIFKTLAFDYDSVTSYFYKLTCVVPQSWILLNFWYFRNAKHSTIMLMMKLPFSTLCLSIFSREIIHEFEKDIPLLKGCNISVPSWNIGKRNCHFI